MEDGSERTADELEARALQALPGFVGGQSVPRMSVDDAVRLAREIETDA